MSNKLNTFQRVRELTGWHGVAFSMTLIERMLPNYQLFCQLTEFADAKVYRNCADLLWEWLSAPKSKINFSVQAEKIEVGLPDTKDFDNFGVLPAIDVGMSLLSVIHLITAEDPQGAVVVSKLSQGSVEAFIEATADPAEPVKQHPLMQWEVDFQNELLDILATMQKSKDNAIRLRAMARAEGISNIGLEML